MEPNLSRALQMATFVRQVADDVDHYRAKLQDIEDAIASGENHSLDVTALVNQRETLDAALEMAALMQTMYTQDSIALMATGEWYAASLRYFAGMKWLMENGTDYE